MKKTLAAAMLCLFLAGCASTEITYVYKAGNYKLDTFRKLAVLAVIPNTHGRVEVEEAVVAAMNAKGIHAVTTWSIFPLANNTELIKKAGFEGEKAKEIVREKVEKNSIDGLLIITMFDSKKEQRYVGGSSTAVGIGVGMPGYPVYGYPYYAYFGYAWEVASEPGYYVDASTYFIESNLYDISTEKLVWTGQTKTKMQTTLTDEAAHFGKVLTDRMISDSKVVTP